jgi:DMSO/TMAO reductase YedYZ molybdopterin-dependent catalytic subunit
LHYTGSLANIDIEKYRLRVSGLVTKELSLSYEELRCLPKVVSEETVECVGFFVDTATWGGVPIKELLKLAGVKPGATNIRLVADDGYTAQISLADAYKDGYFLAYELEGKTLPQLHGFPLRAVLRGETGFQWVKWLVEVQVH